MKTEFQQEQQHGFPSVKKQSLCIAKLDECVLLCFKHETLLDFLDWGGGGGGGKESNHPETEGQYGGLSLVAIHCAAFGFRST